MKKLPSFGFVFLLSVLCTFLVFIFWVAGDGWYDNFSTTSQPTKNDLITRALYLKKLARDSNSNFRKGEYLLEAAKLRNYAGELDSAIADLEQGLYFSPDHAPVKSMLSELYGRAGQTEKGVRLADMPFSAGEKRRETVSSLLTEAFGDSVVDLQERLAAASIKSLGDGRTLIVGVSGDLWTIDGKPGFLVVPGFPDQQLSQDLFLSCYAADKYLPVTVTINNGTMKIVHVFHERGRTKITLPPVAAGSNGLFTISTDKYWISSTRDRRKLGVRIQPVK